MTEDRYLAGDRRCWRSPPASSSAAAAAAPRDQIRIVGSSTVYPFTTAVAEQFARNNPGMKAPIVESTGTGAGMKLFCAGVGAQFPDIDNASRRIKESEFEDCAKNGVKQIVEIPVGIDGIALTESKTGAGIAADRRPTSTRRSPPTRSASRRPPRPGRTSIRRCPRSRSRSTARRRPPARATPSPS